MHAAASIFADVAARPWKVAAPRWARSKSMMLTRATASWRSNLVTDDAAIKSLALSARRVAVLGIKTEATPDAPSFHVPQYLQEQGVTVAPVPVYFPEVTHILGEQVYRSCAAVPSPLDIVCVFRRPSDVLAHVEDVIASKPACVWLQLGIRNDEAAEAWAKAGIKVVQDRCMLVEHAAAKRNAKL